MVRENAATALGLLGDRRAVQPLQNRHDKEKKRYVRKIIRQAIKKLR